MKPEQRGLFEQWYNQHQSEAFDLKEQLAAYCVADVNLLSAALVKFQALFREETRFDVLERSTTIAGACMTHFRANIMREGEIGITNELSYELHGKQSSIARKYLKWFALKHDVRVQDVDSPEGEFRLAPNIWLDGYVRGGLDGNSLDLAIEINGYFESINKTKIINNNITNNNLY